MYRQCVLNKQQANPVTDVMLISVGDFVSLAAVEAVVASALLAVTVVSSIGSTLGGGGGGDFDFSRVGTGGGIVAVVAVVVGAGVGSDGGASTFTSSACGSSPSANG
jgi:hypothetical protein